MILDGHIHIRNRSTDRETFTAALRRAGVDGGIVISLPPAVFTPGDSPPSPAQRADHVLACCAGAPHLYPFFWIDPLEADAAAQVHLAHAKGVAGFKVICDRYFPGDSRALEVFKAIAATGKPILFHSGILWDGKPSSRYNRPAEFEALLDVQGLRFSLAHISWPWCDELIAVYGKFLNAQGKAADADVELFIDTTPGTPPIYRREALTRLFTVGYDIERNVWFGSDSCFDAYNSDWVVEWLERDRRIFEELSLARETVDAVHADNLLRFVGVTPAGAPRKAPKPGM